CIGELALTGELRSVNGCLPAAMACRKEKRGLLLPVGNANEAAYVKTLPVLPAKHLLEVCAHLNGKQAISAHTFCAETNTSTSFLDLLDVKGQESAKRALEIAAAGNHNLLMIGCPGTGKTMLASRLPGILPELTETEALQVAAIRSIAHRASSPLRLMDKLRPFRNPHHTASAVALVGGGSQPRPGEISLAHNGVLFLDELPEFQRHALDVLRQPLEPAQTVISRP